MNWSEYSRFVGDVFGAPLAMEGLAAFFLESTFLGLWWFGWDVLPRRAAPPDDLGGGGGCHAVGGLHHGRQLVDAAPSGLRARRRDRSAGAHLDQRPVRQPGVRVGLHARGPRVARDRQPGHDLGLRVADPTRKDTRGLPALDEALARSAAPGLDPHPPGRQPTRRHRDQVSADEGRGDGGAVGHLPAVLLLRRPDRRLDHLGRGPEQDHRDPAPPLDPGHPAVGRQGRRHQRAAGPVRADLRPRRLHPQPVHPVLVDAGDGLPRCGPAGPGPVGLLPVVAGPAAQGDELPLGRHLRLPGAVRDEHGRLAADRERPPAVGRARPPAHRGRELALRQRDRGRRDPGHLRRPVPRARHRVGNPDAALRQAAAGASPRPVRRRRRAGSSTPTPALASEVY